jgi:hypothetical protein
MERNSFKSAINELSFEEMLMLKGGNAGPVGSSRDETEDENPDITVT